MADKCDRVMGMIIGHALGDALGAPHEFRYQKKNYTGKLEHDVVLLSKWQPRDIFPPGSVTDDTQMALTLLNSLYEKEKYDEDDVIQSYIKWANSGVKMLGRNTRALFKGIKTVRGYRNRHTKFFVGNDQVTQSNGSLMRAYPLVFVDNTKQDCELTNPNAVNILCSMVYIGILKRILEDIPKNEILEWLGEIKGEPEVREAIQQGLNKLPRNITEVGKGWVVHALYITIYSYVHIDNTVEMYKWIITQWGDTDTNAAIAGAVKGLELGFQKVKEEQEENIEILVKENKGYFGNLEELSSDLVSTFL